MQRGRSCGHRTVARPHRQGSGRSAPRSHAVAWKIGNEGKILRLHMSSPEIALCVFFKLLPVEPILVRPHPDSNLLNKMRIFSLLCLFVCSPGCHRSERAGKDGGNLSQQGSSLHEQSQSFVSHFTSFLFIQLCSNKAQEYLVWLFSLLYLFEIRLWKSTVVFSLRHCVLFFCNSSLHKQSQSTFRSTNPCRVQYFVFLQFVFA